MARRSSTYEKVLVLPDIHVPNHDPEALQIALDFKNDWKPNKTIILGDLIDADAVSTFARGEVKVDQWEEYARARQILDEFKPQVLLEGNHEQRFRRPTNIPWALWRIVDPYIWFEIHKRNIQWVPYSNQPNKVFRLGKLAFIHGFSCNEYASKNEALAFGCVVHGHTHRISQFQPKASYTSHTGFNIGCLCKLDLEYQTSGPPRGWAQGFAYGYIFKSGDFSLYQVRLIGDEFVIEGKVYRR